MGPRHDAVPQAENDIGIMINEHLRPRED